MWRGAQWEGGSSHLPEASSLTEEIMQGPPSRHLCAPRLTVSEAAESWDLHSEVLATLLRFLGSWELSWNDSLTCEVWLCLARSIYSAAQNLFSKAACPSAQSKVKQCSGWQMLTRLAAAPAASQQLKQAPVRMALLWTAARCWHCSVSCSPAIAQVFVVGFVILLLGAGRANGIGAFWRQCLASFSLCWAAVGKGFCLLVHTVLAAGSYLYPVTCLWFCSCFSLECFCGLCFHSLAGFGAPALCALCWAGWTPHGGFGAVLNFG